MTDAKKLLGGSQWGSNEATPNKANSLAVDAKQISQISAHINTGSVQPRTAENVGVVYFFDDDAGNIKIGHSRDPQRRLTEVNSYPIERLDVATGTVQSAGWFPASRKVEFAIHRQFAHLRINREWFRESPELRVFIADVITPGTEEKLRDTEAILEAGRRMEAYFEALAANPNFPQAERAQ